MGVMRECRRPPYAADLAAVGVMREYCRTLYAADLAAMGEMGEYCGHSMQLLWRPREC